MQVLGVPITSPIELEFKPRWWVYLIGIGAFIYYLQREQYIHLEQYAAAGYKKIKGNPVGPGYHDVSLGYNLAGSKFSQSFLNIKAHTKEQATQRAINALEDIIGSKVELTRASAKSTVFKYNPTKKRSSRPKRKTGKKLKDLKAMLAVRPSLRKKKK